MTDTPEVNDIPAILAFAREYKGGHGEGLIASIENMAAEILSLRAQLKESIRERLQLWSDARPLNSKRLAVLEELNRENRLSIDGCGWITDHLTKRDFDAFSDLADAELSRREKGTWTLEELEAQRWP